MQFYVLRHWPAVYFARAHAHTRKNTAGLRRGTGPDHVTVSRAKEAQTQRRIDHVYSGWLSPRTIESTGKPSKGSGFVPLPDRADQAIRALAGVVRPCPTTSYSTPLWRHPPRLCEEEWRSPPHCGRGGPSPSDIKMPIPCCAGGGYLNPLSPSGGSGSQDRM